MKAKYVGGESLPGTQETVVFGMKIKCGEVFDVPPQFRTKVTINPAFELIVDKAEDAARTQAADQSSKARKKKDTPQ